MKNSFKTSILNYLLLTVFVCSLISCSAPQDTRKGVPVVMGIRMSPDADENVLKAELLLVEKMGCKEVMIEYPLKADTANHSAPLFDTSLIHKTISIARLIHDAGFALDFSICSSTRMENFAWELRNESSLWFLGLNHLADTLLELLHPIKIRRLIFGKNLMPVEQDTLEWKYLFSTLRHKSEIKISYAADIDRLGLVVPLLKYSDEIAIVYRSPDDEISIEYNRSQNHSASLIADSLKKAVFIFQANLLGEKPQTTFENRLKFWSPDLKLDGITINTLFPRFAVADTFIYFGLATKKDFLRYLEHYSLKDE